MDKWSAATISGLLFLLVSSPYSYNLTNSFFQRIGLPIADYGGCPNITGQALHAIIFTLIVRAIMEKKSDGCIKPYTSKDKWIVAVIGGVMFILFSSPFFYDLIDTATGSFGFSTANDGCPNLRGSIVHSVLFVLTVRLLIR
jgi:hypothetical protein